MMRPGRDPRRTGRRRRPEPGGVERRVHSVPRAGLRVTACLATAQQLQRATRGVRACVHEHASPTMAGARGRSEMLRGVHGTGRDGEEQGMEATLTLEGDVVAVAE
jgi:hypothetical protein